MQERKMGSGNRNGRLGMVAAIFLGVAMVIGVSEWRAVHAREIMPWRDNLDAGLAEAKTKHGEVFAYFTATWCGPCQSMKHDAWADEGVRASMLRRYIPVKIDADQHPELVEKYSVRGFPTFIVLSDDGAPVRQAVGALEADQMRAWLEK